MVSWELLMETLWNFVIKITIYIINSILFTTGTFHFSCTYRQLLFFTWSKYAILTGSGAVGQTEVSGTTGSTPRSQEEREQCTRGPTIRTRNLPHFFFFFFFSTLRVLGQLLRLSTAACRGARTLEVNRTTSVDTPPFQTLAPFGDADATLARSPVLWHQLTVRWVERETTYLFSLKKTDSVDSSLFPVPW